MKPFDTSMSPLMILDVPLMMKVDVESSEQESIRSERQEMGSAPLLGRSALS